MSILCGTEAVFVTSPSDRAHQDTARCFYLLASGLLTCLWLFEQPSDAQHCIEYFRYLEFQPPEVFGFLSDHVKVYVLWALALHLEKPHVLIDVNLASLTEINAYSHFNTK